LALALIIAYSCDGELLLSLRRSPRPACSYCQPIVLEWTFEDDEFLRVWQPVSTFREGYYSVYGNRR